MLAFITNLIALTATSWPLLQLWWPLLHLWMALTATSQTQRWPLLQLPVIFKYLIVWSIIGHFQIFFHECVQIEEKKLIG